MSEIGKELLDPGWENRPYEKMKYIHDEMAKINPIKMDPTVLKIYKHFGAEVFRRSTVPLAYGDIAIRKFMKGKKIRRALEIGTWNGIPSTLMAEHAGEVLTIDIADEKRKYEVWQYMGVENKIQFYQIQSEWDKEVFLSKQEFDFCLMDGNHNNYTYSDWMMVRKCGRVLFHEYWTKQEPVMELVDNLPEKEVTRLTIPKQKVDHKNQEIYEVEKELPWAYWEKK